MTDFPQGPYLNAAVLCEKVIEEADHTVSLMRIVDRITVNATPTALGWTTQVMPPETMPPVQVNTLSLFISFKSGRARGSNMVNVQLEQPNGMKAPLPQQSVLFEGEDKGVNLIMRLNLVLGLQGLYWFEISLEDKFLTRVPLRLVYNRQALSK